MDQRLNIVLAHGSEGTRQEVERAIEGSHTVAASCRTAAELAASASRLAPDLIVTGVSFPDGDGIQTVIRLGERRPIPAVIVTARRSMDLVVKAMRDHVMAYLIEPVTREDLLAAIIVAWSRFEQLRELEEQIGDLQCALEQRKVIERAKGILMASGGLTEQEAFARLRRTAQDRRKRMTDVAEEILAAIDRMMESGE